VNKPLPHVVRRGIEQSPYAVHGSIETHPDAARSKSAACGPTTSARRPDIQGAQRAGVFKSVRY
jgi:hypothetical protein